MNKIHALTYCLFLNIFTSNILLASIHTTTSNNIESGVIKLTIPHFKLAYASVQPTTEEIDQLEQHPNIKKNIQIIGYQLNLQTLHNEIDRQSPRITIAMKKKRDCNKRLSCLMTILCYPCITRYY